MWKFLLLVFFAAIASTLRAEDVVAVDTLAFTANNTTAEPDPNNNEYVFSLFGSADNTSYKIQIDYKSTDMYGEFSDDDFDLAGSGKYYNYLRTTDGSKVWYFKHLDVAVSEADGGTFVSLNGLIQVYGEWRRVLATGSIAPIIPNDTIDVNLGHVSVIPNNFLGYTLLEASNSDYSLSFGLSGYSELKTGTYYQTELLRPDFIKLPDEKITASTAELVITDTDDGNKALFYKLVSTDNTLYQITMNTGEAEITGTIDIPCSSAELYDYAAMYNIYMFKGKNNDYEVAFSVRPGVIEKDMLTIPCDSVDLSYTQVYDIAQQKTIRVEKAEGHIVVNGTNSQTVYADLIGANGILYRVSMPFGSGGTLPEAIDTTYVDCGNYVGRLDYTKGAGWLGLVLGNNDVDVHVTVNNGMKFKGTFTQDMFNYEGSYITTYSDNDAVIRFADVKAAELRMDSIGNVVNMELDVVTITDHMYCFRANMQPMKALSSEEVNYDIDQADALMVALRLEKEGDKNSFRLQFQRYDETDEYGGIVGDGEIWDFRFSQDEVDGISGTYGYVDGTLQNDTYHYLYENNTEILLGIEAGTLTIEAGEEVVVSDIFEEDYNTHIYTVSAQMVASNGIIYRISGENVLLCIDNESGDPVEFTEKSATAIKEVLHDNGIKVKKVLRNGIIIIDTPSGRFDTQGRQIN